MDARLPSQAREEDLQSRVTESLKRDYWLDLFTGVTWEEFRNAGSSVSGFRKTRWKTMQSIGIGDYLICYLTGVSRFIGVLEVTSKPFKKYERDIWKDDDFPCRVRVRPIVELTPETGIPVHELRDRLSSFENLKNPHAWTGHFRSSPLRWKVRDGEAVLQALLDAKENPIRRPVDKKKLSYRPVALRTKKLGSVTVPESSEDLDDDVPERPQKARDHTEMQWLLLKLGSDMGFDVWVARNDKGRDFKGKRFTDLHRLRSELPLQFDDATNRTIELIDVLWLDGNAIRAAFEIESTTSIYSGLLRMSDLLAMQPNLNIPLYLVAPEDRREKVITEVNRPTFSRLKPPLAEVCRFIPFNALKNRIAEVSAYLRFLKPEFLDELSESCEIEEV
jgi:hypothetical protein